MVSLKKSALDAYKRSIDLDLSQKDLILQVCNLMLDLPTEDPERTRYWVEQGNKYFPQNLAVKRLRVKMGDSLNGGGGSSVSSIHSSAETRSGS